MPYPNEHACRLRDPDGFQPDSFRRMERKHEGKAYSVILGRLKGETAMTEQAYRYPRSTWTAEQARAHCRAAKGSFEAATGKESQNSEPCDECRDLDIAESEPALRNDRALRALEDPPEGERVNLRAAFRAAPGIVRGVDRDFRPAGRIVGMSAVTGGEVRDRGAFFDSEFLDQVVAFGNHAQPRVKSRFAHPDLSSDGLGKLLGPVTHFRREGDQVLADLEFVPSAHDTPDGDLADYVMRLAEETPELFGSSMVMKNDTRAEEEYIQEHSVYDADGRHFRSPDRRNVKNLRHWRLADLHAVDIVDDPAANPDGLFSRGADLPREAETCLDYALGLSDVRPATAFLDRVHPDRVRRFVASYLSRRGLVVTTAEPHSEECNPAERKEPRMLPEKEKVAAGDVATAAAVEAPSAPQPQKSEEEARAAGIRAERERFAALKALAPGRLPWAVEQYERGASPEEGRAALAALELVELRAEAAQSRLLREEVAKLKAAERKDVPAVGFAGEPHEKGIEELADEFQANDPNLSRTEARRRAHRQFAEAAKK